MNEVKIPVQEFGGQRGEGTYFKGGLYLGEYSTSLVSHLYMYVIIHV